MTTYSISLDDVDLALLNISTHSNNNFLKQEHYEFQVMKSVPDPAKQYTCHICAIEVPVAFAYEHAASAKHQANVRIASVAAERMRAFISALPPSTVKPAGRFCSNCSIIVDEGHEKTKEHRAAALLDKLLCDLMNAYVQDHDEAIFNNKTCEDNVNSNINELKHVQDDNYDEAILKDNNSGTNERSFKTTDEDNRNSDMVAECNNHTIEAIAEVTDEEDQIEENSEATDMTNECNEDEELSINGTEHDIEPTSMNSNTSNEYVTDKIMIDKATNVSHIELCQEELQQFLDEDVEFEYQETIKINIHLNEYKLTNLDSDKFHSYKRKLLSNNIECLVCDCVLGYEEAERHKYDFEHLSRIMNFGSDGNYIREVNDSYSHCIICNKEIENVDVVTHLESTGHDLYEWIHTNTRDINIKAKAKAVEKNSTETNESNTSNQIADLKPLEKIGDAIEYPYEMTLGKVWCVVCECQVPSGVRNREEHIKGFRHRTTVLNKVTTVDNTE
ncbi:uncharacterized protein LOC125239180 [Leguminivora glycinivorella]|uniref:uncharacterized protein LOC125239180 n=1 Tax=Leguminivora glycinivorella TaxID=1035111 RepID=UPI00200EC20A|nr:uncharacterized protein LOC125239180 [Leguminivora glycinivorella]